MVEERPPKPNKDTRADRLAEALRANLRRRKAQAKAQAGAKAAEQDPQNASRIAAKRDPSHPHELRQKKTSDR